MSTVYSTTSQKFLFVRTPTFSIQPFQKDLIGMPFGQESTAADWFEKEKTKPKFIHSLCKTYSVKATRQRALEFISGVRHPPRIVIDYLILLFDTIRAELDDDWETYNITISKGRISPLSLLEMTVTFDSDDISLENNATNADEKFDHYMLMYFVCGYRYILSHPNQRTQLADRIERELNSLIPNSNWTNNFSTNVKSMEVFEYNEKMHMLMSVLDMFLHKFPMNKYAKARMGTIVTRYCGFSGFGVLEHLRKLLALGSLTDLILWFFFDITSIEIDRMFDNNDEIDISHSYCPYTLGMGLAQKSIYTSACNPTIYLICHIVGSLYNNSRSLNAMMKYDALSTCSMNAAIIYLAHRKPAKVEVVSQGSKAVTSISAAVNTEECSDPSSWIAHFPNRKFDLTPAELKILKNAADAISNPRRGSIGEWVKRSFILLVS
ncbi:uncharacterized protein LOC124460584 [Drosophila willistoni]|uniref:uncharacterized protein LOC124460584 n=1 Tax=Drosophila willistoni TaxID=7260 RepID=UPI001F079EF1|nr:uncharacterized protein LOC124460584 [Drosophila willistoni]